MRTLNFKAMFTLIVFVVTGNMFAGTKEKKDSTSTKNCLEVFGIAIGSNQEPIDGVSITLFKENDELEWTEITSVLYHDHSFTFKLDANEYYTIEVSKPGYVSRSVGISTSVPSNISLKQIFTYEFEVELFKEKKNMDDFYLDFPVALISYDKKNDIFSNSNSYTNHIKAKIKESVNEASAAKSNETKK